MAGLFATAIATAIGFNQICSIESCCQKSSAAHPFHSGVAMKHHTIRFTSILHVIAITAGMTLLLMSCGLPLQQAERGQASRTHQHRSSQKIAQLNFGNDASFAVCTEPACPGVTRKTMAVTLPIAPTPTFVIETAATLNPEKIQLTAQQNAPDVIAAPIRSRPAPVIVHFAFGSATLSASGKAVLDQAIPFARQADHIVITGHTDNIGSSRANQALALARASTVRNYLRTRFSARTPTLTLNAQGACCFIASNDTPEGRRQNRRVEIVFRVPEQVAP
jgi:outer membrane protein OmpA-like peptidoglycan-associated protein